MSVYDYVLHFLNRLIFSFLFPLDFAKSKDLKNKTWFLRCFDNGMLGIPAQHDKNRHNSVILSEVEESKRMQLNIKHQKQALHFRGPYMVTKRLSLKNLF